MKLKAKHWLAIGAGVGVLLVASRARAGIKQAAQTVNPASRDNFVYQGVNAIGDTFDDGSNNDSFSLGAWLFEVLNPGAVKRENDSLRNDDYRTKTYHQIEGIAE